jgi:hypothetical protein
MCKLLPNFAWNYEETYSASGIKRGTGISPALHTLPTRIATYSAKVDASIPAAAEAGAEQNSKQQTGHDMPRKISGNL